MEHRNLKKAETRYLYQKKLDEQLQEIKVNELEDIDEIWNTLKKSIGEVAEEICGRLKLEKKQNWMNTHILSMMEERRKYKNINTVEGQKKYKI